MKNYLLLSFLLVGLGFSTQVFADMPLEKILQREAQRNLEKLSQADIPAYYISYRVYETTTIDAQSSFGAASGEGNRKNRILQVIVRVGSPELDNTHEIKENRETGSGYNENFSCDLPLNNDADAISLIIWNMTDNVYKQVSEKFEKIKANISVKVESEDKSPDFTTEQSEKYSEKDFGKKTFDIDINLFKNKLDKYSAVFRDNKDITSCRTYFVFSTLRTYFADTEGRLITENRTQTRIDISASTTADDGMVIPLSKSFFAHNINSLPSDKEILERTKYISEMLTKLRNAPLADTYSGPALLSAEAAGVFFHEFFGHRVEGARMKQETDAQTFKKKISQKVLSDDISVFFDPTIKFYKKLPLSGSYVFDDEGIRGRRVDAVKNGVLTDFLMSRTPIEEHLNSNGHGRGIIQRRPVTRQSNMIIESSKPYTNEELRSMLKERLKKEDKPYGYIFCEVEGGFTQTSRIDANAFNVIPRVVYRVYADDTPDELVRGVNMIGTPLAVFSQISACGDDYSVFNGFCGAESGSIPVSCVAPTVLVNSVETQKQMKSQSLPPILPRP